MPAGDGGLLAVIGDVAGKGLPAAMLVATIVGSIRTAAEDTSAPEVLLRKLNDRLAGRTQGSFATALAAHIARGGWVTLANAGHLAPYVDGREINLPPALPLGILGGAQYEITEFFLAPGSRITFYSDGVIEAQTARGELFGFDRGRELSTQPAQAIAQAAKQFGQQDDITVVTIERLEAAVASAA
jgi:serine phosphatase RsbU (regulator of sigma subunit)